MTLDIFDAVRIINSRSKNKKWTIKIDKTKNITIYLNESKFRIYYISNSNYYYVYDEYGEAKLHSDNELLAYMSKTGLI